VYTASALWNMVDRFLYQWTVLDLDYDQHKVIETLSRLWVRSLGLERPARGPRAALAAQRGLSRPWHEAELPPRSGPPPRTTCVRPPRRQLEHRLLRRRGRSAG